MKGKNKKYINLFLSLLSVLLLSSIVFSEDRDGRTRIKDGKPVSVFNNREELLKNQIESGDFEALDYKGEGKLLALDYKTIEYQNNALDRVSTFVESLMWHGYIVTNPADQTDYGAHDLKSKDLAAFFNTVRDLSGSTNIRLKQEEEELRELLVERNIIKQEPDGAYSGFDDKAVIGVFHYDDEGEYDPGYRKAAVYHEMEHGNDYTGRLEETKAIWNKLDENEKSAFKNLLLAVGDYNTFDPDLEATEFRAYSNTEGGGQDLISLLNEENQKGKITNQEVELLKRFAINTPEGKEFWTASIEEVPETLQEVEEEPTATIEKQKEAYRKVNEYLTDEQIKLLVENRISPDNYNELNENGINIHAIKAYIQAGFTSSTDMIELKTGNVDPNDAMKYRDILGVDSKEAMMRYEGEYGDDYVYIAVEAGVGTILDIQRVFSLGISADYLSGCGDKGITGTENIIKVHEAGITIQQIEAHEGKIDNVEAFIGSVKPAEKPEEKPGINTFDTNGDGTTDKLTINGNDYILDQSSKLFLQSGKEDIAVDMDGNIYELNFYSEMYELKDSNIAIDAYNGERYKLDSKSGFYINEEYPDKAIDPSTGDIYYKEGNLFVHQSEWYAFNPETNEFYVYDYIEGKWVLWDEYYKEEAIKEKPEVKPEEKPEVKVKTRDTGARLRGYKILEKTMPDGTVQYILADDENNPVKDDEGNDFVASTITGLKGKYDSYIKVEEVEEKILEPTEEPLTEEAAPEELLEYLGEGEELEKLTEVWGKIKEGYYKENMYIHAGREYFSLWDPEKQTLKLYTKDGKLINEETGFTAEKWKIYGMEAPAWKEKRIEPPLALEWEKRGFTPEQAEQWIKAGVYSPIEAKKLSDTGKTPQQFQEERMELFKEKLDTNYVYWAGILGVTTIEDIQKLYDAGITLEQLKAHKGRIENVDDFIASLKVEEKPEVREEEEVGEGIEEAIEQEIKIFYKGNSITLTNPDSDETGTYYEGKTADGRDVRYYTTGDNIGKLFEIEVTQTKYFYKIDDKQKIELRYSDDEENYIGIDDKGNKYAYYPDTDKLKRTNKVGYTETIEAKVEEIKGGKKIIKNLLAVDLEIKTDEQIKQDLARIEAEQRRRDVARFMGAILYPTAGALQLQELFDKHLGDDITWFRTRDWRKWGKLGYIDSAIEGLMCDAFHMIGEGPSDIFIKDYPGHYVGGNDLPNLGSILVVNGVRTEYERGEWNVENCNFKPKWFPIKGDDEVKELGYLYKIQWYIKNPYTEKQVESMSRSERKRLGLDEFEGNISYRIIMKGKACSSYDLPSSYKMPSPRYFNLGPGQEHNYNFAYYDLAYMDKICIEFKDWKYNGKDKNYPKNCDKEIKISSLKAEADFVYLPEGTTAAGTLPGIFGPLTGDKSPTGKTKIDCPPALYELLS